MTPIKMIREETILGISNSLRSWAITIAAILISFSGFVISLMCIQSTPDKAAKPFVGAIYFFIGALILIFYFLLMWKKNKAFEDKLLEGKNGNIVLVVQESLSDKILKWVVAVFALFFVLCSLVMSLLCINSLPDKTVQSQAGILYFASGSFVLGVFVFVIWKNWITTRS